MWIRLTDLNGNMLLIHMLEGVVVRKAMPPATGSVVDTLNLSYSVQETVEQIAMKLSPQIG